MNTKERKIRKDASLGENETEQNPVKLKYPVGVFFILGGYLLERFVYYGLFGGVVFYMQRVLQFSASTSSSVKAVMEGLIYLAPIAGAVLADTYLGKFRTIFIMCCCYCVGTVIFTLSSISPMMASVAGTQATGIGGIFILGISAGLMKAVYSSLGPDQFQLPEQRRQQQRFFYAFYWMINAGAFCGQFLTAQLRESVQCFGHDCYMLPFLILCSLMVCSTLVFFSGRHHYKETPPDTTLINSIKCVFYAAKKSVTSRRKPVDHWVDRAKDKYDAQLINEVKTTLRVLLLFTTFPFFWALFYQTSTGMIFQAKRLYDRIGSYRIPPEMTSSVNPFLILILIPLFELVIYPLLDKKKLLQATTSRMILGMALGGVSFFIYGVVNTQVEQNLLSSTQAQLNIYNARECIVTVSGDWLPNTDIDSYSQYKFEPVNLEQEEVIRSLTYQCGLETDQTTLKLKAKHETTVVLFPNQVVNLNPTTHYLKNKDAEAKVRIITDPFDNYEVFDSSFRLRYGNLAESITAVNGSSDFRVLSPQNYTISYNNRTLGIADIRQDGVYDLVISKGRSVLFHLTAPSTAHMLWLLPLYLLITTGEVLFSVSGMDFAYSEAPNSMKAVMQAANLFMITIGLWLYAIITKMSAATNMFEYRASTEAFTYAVGMGINVLIFLLLVRYYDRNKNLTESEIRENEAGRDNPAFQDEHKI